MRRLRFIPVMLAILCASCSKNVIVPANPEGEGALDLTITTEQMLKETKTGTAVAGEIDVNQFRVAIYKQPALTRLYNDSFANTVGKKINLNSGDYKLIAQYGDSLGCGFDKPYYLADTNFTIKPQAVETLAAKARLGNVKVAVKYGQNLSTGYTDYYAIVKNIDPQVNTSLKFAKAETRSGYIPGGKLQLEVYADIDGKGTWKYYKAPAQVYSPKDFVTFNVDTDVTSGILKVTILVDKDTELVEKTIEIPASAVSSPAPHIEVVGFDATDRFNVIDQDPYNGDLYLSIKASSIKTCSLSVVSTHLQSIGVPAKADLLTDKDAAGLDKGGIWAGGNENNIAVDFSGLAKLLSGANLYKGGKAECAALTVEVTDVNNQSATKTIYFDVVRPEAAITINEGDVWAKKLAKASAGLISKYGDINKVTIEYSADAAVWNPLPGQKYSETDVTSGQLEKLTPGKEYKVRAMYNGKYQIGSGTFTTEKALQVGNASFEDWNTQRYSYDITLGGHFDYDWFLPWKGGEPDAWWAVNSKVAMASGGNGAVSNFHVKSCHTAAPSIDAHSGQKSAHIYTVNVGNFNLDGTNSGTAHIGELFIGKAKDDGSHAIDGHAFASRPSKIKFWYKYKASAGTSEKFYAVVELKAADGTSLFKKEITDGPATSTWAAYEIPVTYSDPSKKVSTLVMGFKSCAGNPDTDANSQLEINGTMDFTAHFGSSLRIDDIEMIYE